MFWPSVELNLLIKMEPTESSVFADLVLTVDAEKYKAHKQMFDGLKKGEGIRFEAVI